MPTGGCGYSYAQVFASNGTKVWDGGPRPGYVTCASLYGPATGECLTAAAAGLLSGLGRDDGRPAARVACDGAGGG